MPTRCDAVVSLACIRACSAAICAPNARTHGDMPCCCASRPSSTWAPVPVIARLRKSWSGLIGTAVAPFTGTVALTRGWVVSTVTPVVKVQLKSAASDVPARFLAPVVTVAV